MERSVLTAIVVAIVLALSFTAASFLIGDTPKSWLGWPEGVYWHHDDCGTEYCTIFSEERFFQNLLFWTIISASLVFIAYQVRKLSLNPYIYSASTASMGFFFVFVASFLWMIAAQTYTMGLSFGFPYGFFTQGDHCVEDCSTFSIDLFVADVLFWILLSGVFVCGYHLRKRSSAVK